MIINNKQIQSYKKNGYIILDDFFNQKELTDFKDAVIKIIHFGLVKASKDHHIKINPKGFGEYFIEFAYRCIQEEYKIIEVGYAYGDRKGGVSKSTDNFFVFIKLGLSYIQKIMSLTYNK